MTLRFEILKTIQRLKENPQADGDRPAGCMVMTGDMLPSWGTRDGNKAGLDHFLSCYLSLTV